MTKYIAGLFMITILAFDLFGLTQPGSILNWFMDIGTGQLVGHLIFAAILLIYTLVPQVRYRFIQLPLLLLGLSAFAAGLVGIFSPDYFGYRSNIVLVVDIFFLIEGGILAMLVSLESPVRRIHRVQEGLLVSTQSEAKPAQLNAFSSRSA